MRIVGGAGTVIVDEFYTSYVLGVCQHSSRVKPRDVVRLVETRTDLFADVGGRWMVWLSDKFVGSFHANRL